MTIYILNALLIPIYSMFIKKKEKLCFLISVQMFLIMAFRHKYLGVDLGGYENTYVDIQKFELADILSQFSLLQTIRINLITSVEFGWVLINWMIGRIGFSYHTLLVLNAGFCMISVGHFICKYSKNPVISFIVFIAAGPWYYSFGVLRQTVAMCIILFSLEAILEDKYKKAIILLFLAVLFHRTSLLFFVLIPLARIRIKKIHYIFALIGCGVVSFLGPILAQGVIFPFLKYIGKPSYAVLLNNPISNLAIALWFVAIVFLLIIDFDALKDKELNLMFWGFILFVAIQGVSRYVSTITRFQTVFIIMTGILLANIIERKKIKSDRFILTQGCYWFFFLYMYRSLHGSAIDPYVSIFGYMPFPGSL